MSKIFKSLSSVWRQWESVIVRAAPGVSINYHRGSNTCGWLPLRTGAEHLPSSRLRYQQSSINDRINFGLDKYIKPTPSPYKHTHTPPLLLFLLSVFVTVKCSLWPPLMVFQFLLMSPLGKHTCSKHTVLYTSTVRSARTEEELQAGGGGGGKNDFFFFF